jgi:Protein of unknown function (DUF2917)
MSHNTANSAMLQRHNIANFAPRYACLVQGGVKAYFELENETIHCTEGHLWVTFEGDTTDYILWSGENLVVPNHGRMLVSGPGCYRISKSIDGMDLAVAS